MVDVLRIKRRSSAGAAGAPSSLAAAEIAFNEKDSILYYGFGNSGGNATSVIPIAGPGAFVSKSGDVMSGALTVSLTALPAQGSYFFGNTSTKYLTYDGTKFIFSGGNVSHGSPSASVDAPVTSGTSSSGVWSGGFSGVDRGLIFLTTATSGTFYCYFTQGTTGNAVGSISGTTSATTYSTSSSAELKEDLRAFDAGNIIDQTNVYDFKWKSSEERAYGVLAQQAIDVYPTAVTHVDRVSDDIGEYWGVDYSKYVPVLLQELKTLRARVAQLEGRVGAGTTPT